MLVSAAVSMEDYALMFGAWGRMGVHSILAPMRDAGIRRVYWRTLGCGQAPYPSRITEPLTLWTTDRPVTRWRLTDPATARVLGVAIKELIADFGAFDHMECARDMAREMGIEFYLWHESHMESHGGEYSSFILDHPEWRAVNRWGEPMTGNLSWGYPETIERRMKLLEEALCYEPDGVALDLLKGGDHIAPRVDQHGYSAIGYEPPIADAFKSKTGRDPLRIPNTDAAWVRFRAAYVTEFMRKARSLQKARLPVARFGLFASHKGRPMPAYPDDKPFTPVAPVELRDRLASLLLDKRHVNVGLAGPLEGNLEDLDAWLDEGLLDFVDAAVIDQPACSGGAPDLQAYRRRVEDAKETVGGRAPFGTQLRSWRVPHDLIVGGVRAAAELDCAEVVLMEAQGIQANENWPAVKEAVEEHTA